MPTSGTGVGEGVVHRCEASVEANAAMTSVKPRFAVEAHLNHLFPPEVEPSTEEREQEVSQEEAAPNEPFEQEKTPSPRPLPTSLSQEEYTALSQSNAERHDWIEHLGAQDRSVSIPWYQRVADLRVSTTDPDASMMLTKGGSHLGYQTHYVVDGGKARIILGVLVAPSEVSENKPMLDLLWRARFRWKLRPRQADFRQQVRHRREHCCHRKPTDPCLHSPA